MRFTVKQAAEAIGRSKPTVFRAIKAGRISAVKNEVNGAWEIEPAELHRLYPPVSAQQDSTEPKTKDILAVEAAMLRRELAILTAERERERAQFQAQIDDLRKLMALLPPPPARSWWPFGKRDSA